MKFAACSVKEKLLKINNSVSPLQHLNSVHHMSEELIWIVLDRLTLLKTTPRDFNCVNHACVCLVVTCECATEHDVYTPLPVTSRSPPQNPAKTFEQITPRHWFWTFLRPVAIFKLSCQLADRKQFIKNVINLLLRTTSHISQKTSVTKPDISKLFGTLHVRLVFQYQV
jgi:hypothetical protein